VLSVLREHELQPIYGPHSAVDGLRDASGGLRVVGASGAVGTSRVPEPLRPELIDMARQESRELPGDSNEIVPAIRNHALRIADMNQPFGGFHPDLAHPELLGPRADTGQHLVDAGYAVRGLGATGDRGSALIHTGGNDPGRVATFAPALSADPGQLATQLTLTTDTAADRPVVIDGVSEGLTEDAARSAYAAAEGAGELPDVVIFVLADGSVLEMVKEHDGN
jgi:hypothetical protein